MLLDFFMSVFLITRIKSSPAVFYAGGEKYSVRPEINEVGLFPVRFFLKKAGAQEQEQVGRSFGQAKQRAQANTKAFVGTCTI